MLHEIGVGVEFLCSLLGAKVQADCLGEFRARLTATLEERFTGHWNPHNPASGSAYRCILTTAGKVDPVLRLAVDACTPENVSALMKSITTNLPPYLAVWIDPFEVSYRIGAQGSVCHLTSDADRRSPPNTATVLSATTKPFVPRQGSFSAPSPRSLASMSTLVVGSSDFESHQQHFPGQMMHLHQQQQQHHHHFHPSVAPPPSRLVEAVPM